MAREVPERVVVGHDLAPGGGDRSDPCQELLVERGDPTDQVLGVGVVGRRACRVHGRQRLLDGAHHLDRVARVEPDVWVAVGQQSDTRGCDDPHRRATRVGDDLIQPVVQAKTVFQDHLRIGDGPDILGRRLELVRIRVGPHQLRDSDPGPADRACEVPELGGGGDDGQAPVGRTRLPAASGQYGESGHDDRSEDELTRTWPHPLNRTT